MVLSGFESGEYPCTFCHDINTYGIPFNILWIPLCGDPDSFSIDYDITVLHRDGSVKPAVYRIVFQQIGKVLHIQKVVDCHNLNAFTLCDRPENQSTYPTKSVYSYF